jgi:hypothetical protein
MRGLRVSVEFSGILVWDDAVQSFRVTATISSCWWAFCPLLYWKLALIGVVLCDSNMTRYLCLNSCRLIDFPDQDFSHESSRTASVEG